MMIHEMNLALCTLGSTLGSTGFPDDIYLHMVGHSVDIRRVIGRHSFITGVVSTIHCLSATVCVGGEARESSGRGTNCEFGCLRGRPLWAPEHMLAKT